ncbi:MAG TPA: tetratricopeptide repeat protein [Verrucomicrobiae bacterium]
MKRPGLILLGLWVMAFSLVTFISPRQLAWAEQSSRGQTLIARLMGGSRELFSNQIFAKGDAYMHSGYYPTIFDTKKLHAPKEGESADDHSGHKHDENGRCVTGEGVTDILGKPKDWIDTFSRHFYITTHSHLEQGKEREVLPWLKLAAEMDPNQVDIYTVAAYWLRTTMGKPKEAEEFLREGLRNNPNHPELLLELGKIYLESHKDVDRARNIWELAKMRWYKVEAPKENADTLMLEQIVARLADMEYKAGNYTNALVNYQLLRQLSPVPKVIDEHIKKTQEMIDSGGKAQP